MGDLDQAVAHLSDLALGWEVAADCERRIDASYAEELAIWNDRFSNKQHITDILSRQARNAIEARSNAKRFDKDAAAVRTVLAALKAEQAA